LEALDTLAVFDADLVQDAVERPDLGHRPLLPANEVFDLDALCDCEIH
jgi:hypothetical protein